MRKWMLCAIMRYTIVQPKCPNATLMQCTASHHAQCKGTVNRCNPKSAMHNTHVYTYVILHKWFCALLSSLSLSPFPSLPPCPSLPIRIHCSLCPVLSKSPMYCFEWCSWNYCFCCSFEETSGTLVSHKRTLSWMHKWMFMHGFPEYINHSCRHICVNVFVMSVFTQYLRGA